MGQEVKLSKIVCLILSASLLLLTACSNQGFDVENSAKQKHSNSSGTQTPVTQQNCEALGGQFKNSVCTIEEWTLFREMTTHGIQAVSSTVGGANPASLNCSNIGGTNNSNGNCSVDADRLFILINVITASTQASQQDRNCVALGGNVSSNNCAIEEWTLYRAMTAHGIYTVNSIVGGANPASLNCSNIGGNESNGICSIDSNHLRSIINLIN